MCSDRSPSTTPSPRSGRRARRALRRIGPGLLLLLLVPGVGCGALSQVRALLPGSALFGAPRAIPAGGWKTSVEKDQPLVGRIWDTAGRRFLSEDELVPLLAKARFVLLGESHDNPDHHRLEALVIRRLAAAGRRPAVAFEMLKPSQAPALEKLLAKPGATPDELRRAIRWDESGWPAWSLYEPVFAAVLQAHLPIVPANLSERTLAWIAHHGVAALDAETRTQLDLDRPLPPQAYAALADEIREAHCGYAPEAALPVMVNVQRARDGAMAASLERAAGRPGADGAVLVAGNGHVRRDRGVPWHLRGAGIPAADIASLGFLEVPAPADSTDSSSRGEEHAPSDHANRHGSSPSVTNPAQDLEDRLGSASAFDYVWYTPRVDALDPCTEFRKKLEKLRHMKLPPRGPSARLFLQGPG